jgi:hypothetical protein
MVAGLFKTYRRQAAHHHAQGGRIMDHLQRLFEAAAGRCRQADASGLQRGAATDMAA